MEKFAVFRIHKLKLLGGIGSHIDRKHTPPNADACQTSLNEELLADKAHVSLQEAVEARIQQGYHSSKRIRKDAVKALGLILSGSHQRMKEIEADAPLFASWKQKNYAFMCREFGTKNLVRFTIHRDEKTPHIHCVVVPLTKDGRLSAKELMGGKLILQGYQDRYSQAMACFDLHRGVSKELTGRVHQPTKQYYRALNHLHQGIHDKVEKIDAHNSCKLPSVQEALEEELQKNYQVIADLQLQVKTQANAFKNLQKNNFKEELQRIKQEVNLLQHAISMGYALDKAKSTRQEVVLVKGEDRLVCRQSPTTHKWIYFSVVNDKDQGTIIDFMLNRGYSFQQIRGLRSTYLDKSILVQQASLPERPVYDAATNHKIAAIAIEVFAPCARDTYLQKRGIKDSISHSYKNLKTNAYEAVFGLYRKVNHQGVGQLCSTLKYRLGKDGQSKHYFQKGLPRGVAVFTDASYDRVIITESPLDALSHKQQHEDERSMYVCTCGNISKNVEQELVQLLKHAHQDGKEVVLAFDKDKAGERMRSQLGSYLQEQSCSYQVIHPQEGKDWNEALCHEVSAIKSLSQELCAGTSQLDFASYQEKFTALCKERGLDFKTKYHSEQDLANLLYFTEKPALKPAVAVQAPSPASAKSVARDTLGLNLAAWFDQGSQQEEEEMSQGDESRLGFRYGLGMDEQEVDDSSLSKLG